MVAGKSEQDRRLPAAMKPEEFPEAMQLIDRQCQRFEAAWNAGLSPSAEEFLDDTLPVPRAALLFELLLLEFECREENGEKVAVEGYVQRLPAEEEVIRRAFVHHIALRPTTMLPESGQGPRQPSEDRPASESSRVLNGREFGDYELHELVGAGGMGIVYRARQRKAERIVALKIIRPDWLIGITREGREEVLERFRTESTAAANLRHDHIVPVYDVGDVKGRPYYSMQLIHGESLAELLRHGPLEGRRAARILLPVVEAIAHAHACGVIHRDIKPPNILLEGDRPYVTDFGLAKWADSTQQLTQSGNVLGTAQYMAPEQARGNAAQAGSDIYSLGAMLYEMLTGTPPFQAATVVETMHRVVRDEPVPPRTLNPAIPKDLDTICLKCLEKQPEQRYRTATELAADLRRFLQGESVRARPVSTAVHAWRWCRRNSLAASLGATFTACLLIVAMVAVVARIRVATLQEEAEANRYFGIIRHAQEELLKNQVARADQLLDGCPQEHRNWEWHYLKRLCHRDVSQTVIKGGTASGPLRFSPDGTRIFAGEFSADGTTVFAGASNGDLMAWDATTGRSIKRIGPDGTYHEASGRLVTWDKAREVYRMLDAESGRTLFDFPGGAEHAVVAFSPDGNRLVAWQKGVGLRIIDASDGRTLFVLKGSNNANRSHSLPHLLRFSPDGALLLSAGVSGDTTIWDLSSANIAYSCKLPGQDGTISAAFSPDSRHLAFAVPHVFESRPQLADVQILETRSWRLVCNLSVDGGTTPSLIANERSSFTIRGATSVAFSPDGSRLAVASADSTLRLFEVGAVLSGTWSSQHSLGRLAVPARPIILQVGRARGIGNCIWDAACDRRCHRTFLPAEGTHVALVRDQYVVLKERATAKEGHARWVIWSLDASTGVKRQLGRIYGRHSLAIVGQRNGHRLAFIDDTGVVRVWDLSTHTEVTSMKDGDHQPFSVALSANGERVAVRFAQRIRVFDVASRALVYEYECDEPPLADSGHIAIDDAGRRVAFSHHHVEPSKEGPGFVGYVETDDTGRRVAFASRYDAVVVDVDRRTALTIKTAFMNHPRLAFVKQRLVASGDVPGGKTTLAVWSPVDGRPILSSSTESRIRVENIAVMHKHSDVPYADFRLGYVYHGLISNKDGIDIWDVQTGKQAAMISTPKWSQVLAFSPNGDRVVIACQGSNRLFDSATGREILDFGVLGVARFSDDGNSIIMATTDGALQVYDGTPVDKGAP